MPMNARPRNYEKVKRVVTRVIKTAYLNGRVHLAFRFSIISPAATRVATNPEEESIARMTGESVSVRY